MDTNHSQVKVNIDIHEVKEVVINTSFIGSGESSSSSPSASPPPPSSSSLSLSSSSSSLSSSSTATHEISSSSSSLTSITAISGITTNLSKLLPTGTVMAFQFLTPRFTNEGNCDSVTHKLTLILIILMGIFCFLISFTDTVKASNGKFYSGFATFKGLWVVDCPSIDKDKIPANLNNYKLRFIDFVHAFLSLLVFFVIALKDNNVLKCYYPHPATETKEILNILPIGIGLLCSLLFIAFPTTRHGFGFCHLITHARR